MVEIPEVFWKALVREPERFLDVYAMLVDWCIDNGDDAQAWAWRWLYENKKRPCSWRYYLSKKRHWQWRYSIDDVLDENDLPFQSWHTGRANHVHSSYRKAMRAAVAGLVAWREAGCPNGSENVTG